MATIRLKINEIERAEALVTSLAISGIPVWVEDHCMGDHPFYYTGEDLKFVCFEVDDDSVMIDDDGVGDDVWDGEEDFCDDDNEEIAEKEEEKFFFLVDDNHPQWGGGKMWITGGSYKDARMTADSYFGKGKSVCVDNGHMGLFPGREIVYDYCLLEGKLAWKDELSSDKTVHDEEQE